MVRDYLQSVIIIVIICLLYACASNKVNLVEKGNDGIAFKVPVGWPDPVYAFSKNPLTQTKIELGRRLFYDPILSRDTTISCASCHLSFTAFTHTDHDLSHGIDDRIGTRNSSALMNLAWSPSFMWDGAINHLDMQALAPISHPDEMDFDVKSVIDRMNSNESYQMAFNEAWGDGLITGENFLKSISQFMLTMVTANSKYDQVVRGEDAVSFTEKEQKGYDLFKLKCASCHKEPLFTDFSFKNNGLPVDLFLNDKGRMLVTGDASDSLKFKVPTLRNIEFSYPYMHDGRFRKLKHVLAHYSSGIEASNNLADELKGGIVISADERVELIAFLKTLTDQEFLMNKDLSFPQRN